MRQHFHVGNSNANCPNRPSQNEFRKRVPVRPAMRDATSCPCGIRIAGFVGVEVTRLKSKSETPHVVSYKFQPAKAPEDWRTPRRFAFAGPLRTSARFWTAAALRRFQIRVHPRLSAVKNLASVFREQIFQIRRGEAAGETFFAQHVGNCLRLALLQFPDFFLDRAGRDEPVGVYGLRLADAV